MRMPDMPYSSAFDLGSVPDRGAELVLKPTEAERDEIAHWLGIDRVERLEAWIRLSRMGADRYDYRASFDADIVQACVITLDPVRTHLSGEFHRGFEIMPKALRPKKRSSARTAAIVELLPIAVFSADADEAERLESPIVDLAAPVLEELSLVLDPYPRAPGAAFDASLGETQATDNPFAVLEKLKKTSGRQSSGPARHGKNPPAPKAEPKPGKPSEKKMG